MVTESYPQKLRVSFVDGKPVRAIIHDVEFLPADRLILYREALEEAVDQLWLMAKDPDENYLVKRLRAVLSRSGG